MDLTESNMEALDLNQQGVILVEAGNYEAAKEKYNKAIDIDPMVVDSYKNIGDLYLRSGEFKEAKNFYKKALLIEKRGDIYFQYGNACFMNDEPHEGLEYYNLALSAGFDSDEMFFFMAMAYEHMNDDNMALRYVQKALVKNPSRPDYKVKKISIMLRLSMMDEAKSAVEELLLNDPELYDGYHIKTAILLSEKDYVAAAEFSKKASEKFPEDADLLYDYASATALAQNYDQAIAILEKAKKMKYFEHAQAKFLLLEAEINAELEQIDVAISKCKECLVLETEDEPYTETRFMLINLLLTKSEFNEALEHANAIIEKNEKGSYYFAALYYRPFCLEKLERKDEANLYYKEAISLYRMATIQNPEAFDAYLYRIMCLRDMEVYDEALELLEFLENLNNEIAEIYTIRADIYKLTGKESLMREALERAFELKPELKESFAEGGE